MANHKRKICVVIGSRANYSSIKSAMSAITNHPGLKLQIIAMASSILDKYGNVSDLIEGDGFLIDERLHTHIEGESPVTMAMSTGLALVSLPGAFERLAPDIVLTIGDRFETMATTLAAAYMNIPIAHTMGGEVSGTIDESIRHAVTKFAHIHFPASNGAKKRILRLGELPLHVHMVGCPRIDLVKSILNQGHAALKDGLFNFGVGGKLNLSAPFLLVSQHPVTTEYGSGEGQITRTLEAVSEVGMQAIVLWPNSDAGSDDIAKGIRKWREAGKDENMHFFKNLPTELYISLMDKTSCLIGNSSSGIREGAYIGTPVVNIGSRQNAREMGQNVLNVDGDKENIIDAIKFQVNHGKYNKDTIYGDGVAGVKIAEILASETVNIQKCITY
ncbi:UDP-N-acetylglucosamine 2-epimerase (hydrolyzing) [Polynucleobacter sp. AP-Elch-400A-B2]|uniref:UDP-N-acetylglucosamine 2-epimerase n=1 Tax=Polynucleobacter sp. AP-Elch-400A-B2 TaxID=2576930 RepID=UPI001BFE2A09|nr:UDP-N-acetylglucosamine 2-epimerase [Polynucleobacter sp. AP-Elch-400A-B2]QWE24992.1 UDP-N-acetylglucosamine 2-epimerase (hydrolyzing) [Polynucleobacter sp. AP-Elch-400A-B2]